MGKAVVPEMLAYVQAVGADLLRQTGVNITALSFDLKKIEDGHGDLRTAFESGVQPAAFADRIKTLLSLSDAAGFETRQDASRFNLRRAALATLCRESPEWKRDADASTGAVFRVEDDGRVLRVAPSFSSDGGEVGFTAKVAERATVEMIHDSVRKVSDAGTGSAAAFAQVSAGFDIKDVVGDYELAYGNSDAAPTAMKL
jgi:hypothetical protein